MAAHCGPSPRTSKGPACAMPRRRRVVVRARLIAARQPPAGPCRRASEASWAMRFSRFLTACSLGTATERSYLPPFWQAVQSSACRLRSACAITLSRIWARTRKTPMPRRRDAPGPEDQDAAGEPGYALILLGAIIHAGLSLKAALARQIARRRAAQQPGWPEAAQQPDGAFARPLDLATEPLLWPQSEQGESNFDASAYAPPAARAASGRTPSGQSQDQDPDIYAPRRGIARVAGALKPGSRARNEVQPSLCSTGWRGPAMCCRRFTSSASRRSRSRTTSRRTRSARTPDCLKGCSRISASRARSFMSGQARW